jgi:D-3-phosphoglycerate dehydrogenase
MGQAFAKRLVGFGCKILVYDKYKSGFSDPFCKEATMEQVFDKTDVLSLHIPLTHETKRMFDEQYFNRFKKNIIVLNTARGEILPLTDLVKAMESGKVRAAALDVLENEKLSTLTPQQQQSMKYLASKSNVIFTPHIAGWTFESHVKINVALVNKIKLLGQG